MKMYNGRLTLSPAKIILCFLAVALVVAGVALALDGSIWLGIGVGYLGFLLVLALWCHGIAALRDRDDDDLIEDAAYRTERPAILPPPPANAGDADPRIPPSDRLPAINDADFIDEE